MGASRLPGTTSRTESGREKNTGCRGYPFQEDWLTMCSSGVISRSRLYLRPCWRKGNYLAVDAESSARTDRRSSEPPDPMPKLLDQGGVT